MQRPPASPTPREPHGASRCRPVALGPFDLLQPIGRGGMGVVWLARHRARRQRVAVKVVSAREDAREALLREGRRAAGLEHPHIAAVLDLGVAGDDDAVRAGLVEADTPWLGVAYAAGGSLGPWCGRLGWEVVRHLLACTLEGLAHAHARGIVHLDLKPENLLLDGRPEPTAGLRITDFGLCHALGEAADVRDRIAGTPAYMAPEQCTGEWRELGPWTDLYALGCVAWALVSGAPPFVDRDPRAIMARHVGAGLPPLWPRAPVPADLVEWLGWLLEKDPAARPRSVAEAVQALAGLGAPDDRPTPVPAAPEIPTDTATFVLDTPVPALRADHAGPSRVAPSPRPAPVLPERPPEEPIPSLPALQGGLGVLAHRRAPLVGRAEERRRLWDVLGEVVRGPGAARLVLLTARPGHGRTRLATWLAEQAVACGAVWTVEARGGSLDALRRAVARALYADGLDGAALATQVARACRIRGIAGAQEVVAFLEGDGDAVRVLEALAPGPARRSGPPLVLLWDDIDAPEALDALERVLAARPDLRLLCVAGICAPEVLGADATSALARLRDLPAARTLELTRLDSGAVRALADHLLLLDPEARRGVCATADGCPGLLVDLLVDLVRHDELEGPGRASLRPGGLARTCARLADRWRDRVDGLIGPRTAPEDEALELAARAGPVVGATTWTRGCERAALDVVGLADRMVDRGIWEVTPDGWRFRDPIVRTALLYRPEAAARRTAHHAVIAEALPDDHPDRGFHLLESGALDAAAPALFRLARDTGDPWVAGAALEAWRRATGSRPRSPEERATVALLDARLADARDDSALVERITANALPMLDLLPPNSRSQLLRIRARALREIGRLDEATEAARRAVAEASGGQRLVALQTLAIVAKVAGRLDEAERILATLVRDERRQHARADWANVLRMLGRIDEAHAVLEGMLADAEGPSQRIPVLNALGTLALERNDLAEAEARWREACQEASGWVGSAGVPAYNLATLLIRTGRSAHAAVILRGIRPRVRLLGQSSFEAAIAAALFGASSDPDELEELLEDFGPALSGPWVAREGIPVWLEQGASVLAAVDRPDLAARALGHAADLWAQDGQLEEAERVRERIASLVDGP